MAEITMTPAAGPGPLEQLIGELTGLGTSQAPAPPQAEAIEMEAG